MRVHIYFNNEKNIFAPVQRNIAPEIVAAPSEKTTPKVSIKNPQNTNANGMI